MEESMMGQLQQLRDEQSRLEHLLGHNALGTSCAVPASGTPALAQFRCVRELSAHEVNAAAAAAAPGTPAAITATAGTATKAKAGVADRAQWSYQERLKELEALRKKYEVVARTSMSHYFNSVGDVQGYQERRASRMQHVEPFTFQSRELVKPPRIREQRAEEDRQAREAAAAAHRRHPLRAKPVPPSTFMNKYELMVEEWCQRKAAIELMSRERARQAKEDAEFVRVSAQSLRHTREELMGVVYGPDGKPITKSALRRRAQSADTRVGPPHVNDVPLEVQMRLWPALSDHERVRKERIKYRAAARKLEVDEEVRKVLPLLTSPTPGRCYDAAAGLGSPCFGLGQAIHPAGPTGSVGMPVSQGVPAAATSAPPLAPLPSSSLPSAVPPAAPLVAPPLPPPPGAAVPLPPPPSGATVPPPPLPPPASVPLPGGGAAATPPLAPPGNVTSGTSPAPHHSLSLLSTSTTSTPPPLGIGGVPGGAAATSIPPPPGLSPSSPSPFLSIPPSSVGSPASAHPPPPTPPPPPPPAAAVPVPSQQQQPLLGGTLASPSPAPAGLVPPPPPPPMQSAPSAALGAAVAPPGGLPSSLPAPPPAASTTAAAVDATGAQAAVPPGSVSAATAVPASVTASADAAETAWRRYNPQLTFKPNVKPGVPNFAALWAKNKTELAEKKRAPPTTTPQPFDLTPSARAGMVVGRRPARSVSALPPPRQPRRTRSTAGSPLTATSGTAAATVSSTTKATVEQGRSASPPQQRKQATAPRGTRAHALRTEAIYSTYVAQSEEQGKTAEADEAYWKAVAQRQREVRQRLASYLVDHHAEHELTIQSKVRALRAGMLESEKAAEARLAEMRQRVAEMPPVFAEPVHLHEASKARAAAEQGILQSLKDTGLDGATIKTILAASAEGTAGEAVAGEDLADGAAAAAAPAETTAPEAGAEAGEASKASQKKPKTHHSGSSSSSSGSDSDTDSDSSNSSSSSDSSNSTNSSTSAGKKKGLSMAARSASLSLPAVGSIPVPKPVAAKKDAEYSDDSFENSSDSD